MVQADVADPEAAHRVVEAGPDPALLVNCAGVQVTKTVPDSTDADWDSVVGINCRGVFNMCRAVIPRMGQGVIVNIGSSSGHVADPGMALYNAPKAFVHGLTRSIAIDHGPDIRCNAICPGWIDTGMADEAFDLAQDPAAARTDTLARHPAGRLGRPEDVAGLVAYLASDDAAFMTGECLTIDGGSDGGNTCSTQLVLDLPTCRAAAALKSPHRPAMCPFNFTIERRPWP